MAKIALNVDGKSHTIEADNDMPLLYALRDELGLRTPKCGCGLAQCGACTVIIDGVAVRSCVTPVDSVQNTKITTLAGLGGGKAHALQEAFIAEQVPQCGYCINGWVMTAAAFLEKNPKPTEDQMKEALTGIKCRCGTHMAILRAVMRVAHA
jgi:nicotinate dehydrogenase subunit A